MGQISRPFQIAFAAIVLLAGVWLFALHGRSNSTSEPSAPATPAPAAASASTPSAAAASSSGAGAGSTHVYTGAAPGVSGLTRALSKAHEAVATSQANAHQLEADSAAASSASTGGASAPAASATKTSSKTVVVHKSATVKAAAPATAKTSAPAPSVKHTTTTTVTVTHAKAPAAASGALAGIPHNQASVEAKLRAGDVVMLLFWDRKGADDVAVHRAVQTVIHSHGARRLALQQAGASQVASFGSITKGIAVYGTPTLLILAKSGKTITITGLTDPYSIDQAIEEARRAAA